MKTPRSIFTLPIAIAAFLIGLLLALADSHLPPPRVYTVSVNTNQVLVAPRGFFSSNSAAIYAAISNQISRVPFRAATNGNLYLTVDPGYVTSADGSKIEYSGGTVQVLAGKTNYVCLDIGSLQLGVFPRCLDRGSVLIAVAKASATKITNVYQPPAYILPRSRIEPFKRKLLAGTKALKVIAIGDSLMGYTAGERNYIDMVFDATAASYGFNVPYVTNVTRINYAAGGQDPRYGLAVLGRHWIPQWWPDGLLALNSLGIDYGPYYSTFLGSYYDDHLGDARPTSESPAIAQCPDLALVCFYNPCTDKLPYLESILRKLKRRGADVILLSCGPTSGELNLFEDEGNILSRLADAYGCEFVDMWARQRARIDAGDSIFTDGLHPNAAGLALWAGGVRSVLNTHVQDPEIVPVPEVRVIRSTDNTRACKFPETMDLICWPGRNLGTVTATVLTNPVQNLALLYGGRAVSNAAVTLTAGQTVTFGHFSPLAWDLLVEGNSGFTAQLIAQGTVIRTVSFSSVGLAPMLVSGMTMEDVEEAAGYVFGSPGLLNNSTYDITVTAGTLKLLGVVVHSLERRELAYNEMTFNGTWGIHNTVNLPSCRYTDTIGDSVVFRFKGRGAGILLQGSLAAGKVDIIVDGVKTVSARDLIYDGSFIAPFFVFPDASVNGNDLTRAPSEHAVQIKLVGVNDEVTSPTNTIRRLSLGHVYIYDPR